MTTTWTSTASSRSTPARISRSSPRAGTRSPWPWWSRSGGEGGPLGTTDVGPCRDAGGLAEREACLDLTALVAQLLDHPARDHHCRGHRIADQHSRQRHERAALEGEDPRPNSSRVRRQPRRRSQPREARTGAAPRGPRLEAPSAANATIATTQAHDRINGRSGSILPPRRRRRAAVHEARAAAQPSPARGRAHSRGDSTMPTSTRTSETATSV